MLTWVEVLAGESGCCIKILCLAGMPLPCAFGYKEQAFLGGKTCFVCACLVFPDCLLLLVSEFMKLKESPVNVGQALCCSPVLMSVLCVISYAIS